MSKESLKGVHIVEHLPPQSCASDVVQCDYAALELRILASLGIPKEMFGLYQKGQLSQRTLLAHLHDDVVLPLDVETDGTERFLGVDYGRDGGTHAVVMTKKKGPNKNGDIFEIEEEIHLQPGEVFTLSEPKFVGKLTEKMFPQKWGVPLIQKVLPALLGLDLVKAAQLEVSKINQQVDEHAKMQTLATVKGESPRQLLSYLKNRQVELAARLKTCAGSMDAEALWEIKREMYQLYREQQRVEALFAPRKEAEVDQEKFTDLYGGQSSSPAVMHTVHLEHGPSFFELRAKNRERQTICYSRIENKGSARAWQFGDLVEGLFVPFCVEVKKKTTENTDYEILNKTIVSLLGNQITHPHAGFLIDCCISYSKQIMATFMSAENIAIWEQAIEKQRGRSLAKSTPYPVFGRDRSKEFQAALKNEVLERDRTMQKVLEKAYSPATKESIKKREEEAPKKLVEHQVAKHEAEKSEKELKERTSLFEPRYCHKCGTDQGCMCPRTPVEPNKDPCQHPFLVLISLSIARELGVLVGHLKKGAKIYACRECQQVFVPFEITGGIQYVRLQ